MREARPQYHMRGSTDGIIQRDLNTKPHVLLVLVIMASVGVWTDFAQEPPSSTAPAATQPNGEKSADEFLQSLGLTKVGVRYVLDAEVRLPERLREYRKDRYAIEEHERQRTAMESQIEHARSVVKQMYDHYRDLNDQLAASHNTMEHNRLAGQINSLSTQIKEDEEAIAKKEKELAQLPDPRDDYVKLVLDLSSQMEEASKRYAELAGDDRVKAAIDRINETARLKVSLGPGTDFIQQMPLIRRQREMISSVAITCVMDGGVPTVEVELNGTVKERMIIDSGASLVTLTWDVAQRLGLEPGPEDAVIKLTDASGRIVKARVTKLKSVRVGQFTVENVICAIQPRGMKNRTCLLGGSFLHNFVYRMDLESGKLYLSQIGGTQHATSRPTTRMTEAPPAQQNTPTTKAVDLPTGAFRILAKKGDFCVGLGRNNRKRGSAAILRKSGQERALFWRLECTEGNAVYFVNLQSRLYLAVGGGKKEPGAHVLQWTPTRDGGAAVDRPAGR